MDKVIYKVNEIEITENLFNYYKDLVIKKDITKNIDANSDNKIYKTYNKKNHNHSENEINSYAKYEIFKRALLLDLAEKNDTKITESELEQKLYRLTLSYNSVEDFKKDVSNLTIGYDRFLTLIAEDLKIEKYLREKFDPEFYSVDISEVVDYFDRNKEKYSNIEIVKVSHILKKITTDSKEELHTLFDELVAIKHMEKSFKEKAEIFSQCPSASKGGDLGFIKKGMMPIDFENVAFKLDIDEISSVVKTTMGLHLIKCTDKLTGFDAVKDDIEYFLINEKMVGDIEEFTQNELSNAEIEEF